VVSLVQPLFSPVRQLAGCSGKRNPEKLVPGRRRPRPFAPARPKAGSAPGPPTGTYDQLSLFSRPWPRCPLTKNPTCSTREGYLTKLPKKHGPAQNLGGWRTTTKTGPQGDKQPPGRTSPVFARGRRPPGLRPTARKHGWGPFSKMGTSESRAPSPHLGGAGYDPALRTRISSPQNTANRVFEIPPVRRGSACPPLPVGFQGIVTPPPPVCNEYFSRTRSAPPERPPKTQGVSAPGPIPLPRQICFRRKAARV